MAARLCCAAVPSLATEPTSRLRLPPPRERRRRLRRRARARRSALGPLQIAVGRADQKLLVAMRTHLHRPLGERAAQALGAFGEYGAGWAAIGLIGAAADPRRRPRLLAAALAGPCAVGLNSLAKRMVGRERPVIEGHPPLGPAPSKLSFPSAHSTSAVAAATVLGRVAPGTRAALWTLAALICVGRPYLGMHYPSDVLAGVALGYGIGRLWPLPPEAGEPEEDR